MSRAPITVGVTFGRLTTIEQAEHHVTAGGYRKAMWKCSCECGATAVVKADYLHQGITRSCGCLKRQVSAAARRAERVEVPSYLAAHARTRRERGNPVDHACVDCGSPAKDWAYDHTDPQELTEERLNPRGKLVTVPYSADPAYYSPRCRSCHTRFDKGR